MSKQEGISQQSTEWEDIQERGVPQNEGVNIKAEKYIKNPSPEEASHNDESDNS